MIVVSLQVSRKMPVYRGIALFFGIFFSSVFFVTESSAAPGGSSLHLRNADSLAVRGLNLNDGRGNKNSRANSLSQDPLAFLEGNAECPDIVASVEKRYRKDRDGANAIRADLLLEEFRHVSLETCSNPKFATCSFHWCRLAKKLSEKPSPRVEVAAVAQAPKEDLREVEIQTSRARLAAPEVAIEKVEKFAPKFDVEVKDVEVTPPVKAAQEKSKIEPVEQVASAKDYVERDVEIAAPEPKKATRAEAPSLTADSGISAGLAVQMEHELPGFSPEDIAAKTVYVSKSDVKSVSMSPEEAHKKLTELLKEKNQQQTHMIQEKKTMEAKFQLAWIPVGIPGSQTSPFRVKSIDSEGPGKGQFMRSKTTQTSASLADHVAADASENDLSNGPLKGKDAAMAKANDPTLSSEQDIYFKMLNSRGSRARGGARGGKAGFPQLSIGDN